MELSLELMLFNKKTIQYNFSLGIFSEESLDNKKELFHKNDNPYNWKNSIKWKMLHSVGFTFASSC